MEAAIGNAEAFLALQEVCEQHRTDTMKVFDSFELLCETIVHSGVLTDADLAVLVDGMENIVHAFASQVRLVAGMAGLRCAASGDE